MPHDKRLALMQAGSADSDRPTLVRLLEAIRQGCVAVVVVSDLDRLARDPAQSAILIEESSGQRESALQAQDHS